MANDPFDDMPKFTLEKDDLESFQRTRAQASNSTGKKDPEPQEPVAPSKGPSWIMFLFFLAVICAVTAYWSSTQYKVLQQAQVRISELENRLSATGEEMDQSTVALGVQVKELSAKTKELWDQMDKLWASAWRRNQADIKKLETSLASVKNSNALDIKSLKETSSGNDTEISLLKEQLTNQSSMLKQVQEQLVQVSSGDAEVEQQLASLREKLISTALANNNLTNRIDDLDRRLKVTEKLTKPLTPGPAL
ncbi:hypothetical protein [Paraglaciecola sp. L3A3]|uniref:hypothetical protein n=1 Tax=Paraglaciecola sp. L3A3 TaxID=2686358 RepID=UPI00131E0824|nr:hypothetical protein [Paraglaciecola sp. L3A3]